MSEERCDKVEELVEVLQDLRPETIYVVKNEKRYKMAEKSIRILAKLAEESNPGGVKFNTAIVDGKPLDDERMLSKLTGTMLGFDIYSDTVIVFEDMEKFREAMKPVDVFEIYAKNNGGYGLSFGYRDVYKYPEHKSKK